MDSDILAVLARREGESACDHYRRLLACREEFEAVLRPTKIEASKEANAAEMERRRVRDWESRCALEEEVREETPSEFAEGGGSEA